MPRFAANLSMLFAELPFPDRFAAAAAAGFRAVECQFPYDYPPADLADRLHRHGLTQILFNLPPGDAGRGERGLAILPGARKRFRAAVDLARTYAEATGCRRLHCLAGIVPAGLDREIARETLVANLRYAARRVAGSGITLLIEPLNTRDTPGYFLSDPTEARRLIDAVGEPNLALQLDLYHWQIMGGDLAKRIAEYADITGHIQIAGVPDRSEPDVGEINYPYLFEVIDRTGYDGWIGCEYRPRAGTLTGLGWVRPWLERDRA